tara:strand:+ start:2427 stop:3986 length:1560 start_codon:yes stop_codon:yes gene_type:complete
MPKGESLEKPKKGGMVLIIGMGAKPKKDKEKMKKQERRRPPKRGGAGAKPRAQKHRFLQLMRKNPNHFDETLKHLKIPRQLFSMYLRDTKGISIEDMLRNKELNIPKIIDQVKKINNQNRGHFDKDGRPNKGLANMLEARGISVGKFKRSLNTNPFQDFQERLNQLATRDNRRRPKKGQPKKGGRKGAMFQDDNMTAEEAEESRQAAARSKQIDDEFRESGYPGLFDKLRAEEKKEMESEFEEPSGPRMIPVTRFKTKKDMGMNEDGQEGMAAVIDRPEHGSDEEEKLLQHYMRLFSHREDPKEQAFRRLRGSIEEDEGLDQNRPEAAMRRKEKMPQDRNPSEVFTEPQAPIGTQLGSPQDDEDPSLGFDPVSIGAVTPKKDIFNPRVLNDPRSPRAGQGTDRRVEDMLMSSSDSRNVMDPAWSLLKGGFSTIDLIARESKTMEEALQSMKESFPEMSSEDAMKFITQAKNIHAREGMMQQQQPVKFANIIDSSPQEMMNLNPNARDKFVSQTGRLDDV